MDLAAFHEAIPGYFVESEDSLIVRVAVKTAQKIRVFARIEPDNEEYLEPMPLVSESSGWQYYETAIKKSTHIERTDYLFKFVGEDDSCWLGSAGIEQHMPRNIHMFRFSHDQHIPMWSASRVFYQIFPERFANGDDSLSPVQGEYRYLDRVDIVAKSWDQLPERKSGGFEFFGGDLIGVKNKLGYLHERLGVDALYLNPVFTSQSSHKYDTTDYFNVDPHFGGNKALSDLVEAAHQEDIKIVLDAVINHTSVMHPWFQAAQNGSDEYRQYYVFEDQEYGSWKDHKSLPTLDFANTTVQQKMITGPDSVIRHWLKPPYQIDGWRMDVIHMLGEGKGAKNNDTYLRLLRSVIKDENPEALLLGEHFFEASAWLQGDQEDCAMNYFGFAHPVRAFFANKDIALDPIKLDAQQFSRWLREARARISFKHQLLQFNQLDSHDTPRFLAMLNGDVALLEVAVGFLMTYIGTPCLYYGTEIGMSGDHDPDCRRTFNWNESEWNQDVFAQTRRWVTLRKTIPSLASGAIVDLFAEGDCMAFMRVTSDSQALIVINRGKQTNIDFNDLSFNVTSSWTKIEGGAELNISDDQAKVTVPEKSITLWTR